MTEFQKKTDILIEKLKQSKKAALEEIKNEYNTPQFQESLAKLRALNKK